MDPSTPNPQVTTLIYTALRAGMTVAGALGIGVGTVSDSNLMVIAGALATLGGVIWSFYEKFQAAGAAHNAAVQSAASGTPINSEH